MNQINEILDHGLLAEFAYLKLEDGIFYENNRPINEDGSYPKSNNQISMKSKSDVVNFLSGKNPDGTYMSTKKDKKLSPQQISDMTDIKPHRVTAMINLLDKYKIVDFTSDDRGVLNSGFQGALYKETGTQNFVIAFRGTAGFKDILVDAAISNILGSHNFQENEAIEFVKKMKRMHTISNDNLTLTGHSLGGILSQSIGVKLKIKAFAYNPLGTSTIVYDSGNMSVNILTEVLNKFNIINFSNDWVNKNIITISYNDIGWLNGDILSNLATKLNMSSHLGIKIDIYGENKSLDAHGMSVVNMLLEKQADENITTVDDLINYNENEKILFKDILATQKHEIQAQFVKNHKCLFAVQTPRNINNVLDRQVVPLAKAFTHENIDTLSIMSYIKQLEDESAVDDKLEYSKEKNKLNLGMEDQRDALDIVRSFIQANDELKKHDITVDITDDDKYTVMKTQTIKTLSRQNSLTSEQTHSLNPWIRAQSRIDKFNEIFLIKPSERLIFDLKEYEEPKKLSIGSGGGSGATGLGIRKDAAFKIICCVPSINKTQVGPAVVPIPYPVMQDFSTAKEPSSNVNFNSNAAYIFKSSLEAVKGDEAGKLGGVKSGKVGGAVESKDSSKSVKINKQEVLRVGDMMDMQSKNTIGKVIMAPPPACSVSDDGAIEGKTTPDDLDLSSMNEPSKSSMSNLNAPSTSRLGASSSSGGLGCRTGSPVLLDTRQLYFAQTDITLDGLVDLELQRTYISRYNKMSTILGNHWIFKYEQKFIQSSTKKNIYTLYLNDARAFEFEYDFQTNSFKDLGFLGCEAKRINESTFEITYNDNKVEYYENEKLISIVDKNNIAISIIYEDDKIVKINNEQNNFFTLGYNSLGLLHTITDHTNRTWQYKYENNNLVEVINPLGGTKRYIYEQFTEENNTTSHLLTQALDETNKLCIGATYNSEAEVVSYSDKEIVYNYTYNHNYIEKRSNTGLDMAYGIDSYSLICAVGDDNVVDTQDFKDNILTFKSNDKVVKKEIYDDKGRLAQVTNKYDELLKELTYNKDSNLAIKINDIENSILEEFDDNGNLTKSIKDDIVEEFKYDEFGNTIEYVKDDITTTYEYDSLNRLTKEIGLNNTFIFYKYDTLNRVIAIIDEENRESKISYDKLNNITTIINFENEYVKYAYDKASRHTKTTDPKNYTTTFTYDEFGRAIKESSKLGNRKISYFKDNSVESYTLQHQTNTKLIFNTQKQLIKKEISENDKILDTTRYTYNEDNKITNIQNNSSLLSFIYNEDGNLTKTIQDGIEIKRSYRDDESLRGIRFLDQNIIQQRREKCNRLDFIYHNKNKINFQYDPNHLLKRVYPNNTFESFEYDDVGNIDSISNCKNQIDYKRDKSQLITNKDNQTFVYDGAQKLIMELVGNINTNEIDILKTNYNKNKRALQLSDYNIENASRKNILDIADETSNDAVNNFLSNENKTNNIDKSFLIESKQPANTRSYYYDAVGNVLNNNSTYNEFKQLTNDDSYIYTYDDKGNLKTKKSKKDNSKKIYTFNAQNQLLKVETKSRKNNFIKSFVFTYDSLNRRVSKTHTSIDNNYSHYYLYDGLNIVAILNNNTKELISTITYDDKIDTPLSITTNNKTYFYSRDHQGNILHLTNENAEIVEEFTYDAYGKITSYHQSEVTLNPYCYTGREFDDVDLYYYRFRYYDPTTKRFLSLDPIGFESGDYNHYRYVFSSPVNYTDPSGLFVFALPIISAISMAISAINSLFGAEPVETKNTSKAVTKAKKAIAKPVNTTDDNQQAKSETQVVAATVGSGGMSLTGSPGEKVSTELKLMARYENPWQTRAHGAKFNLYIDDVKVVSEGVLKGIDAGEDAGTYLYKGPQLGVIRFELITQGKEAEIVNFKKDLITTLNEPYNKLVQSMAQYNEDYKNNGMVVSIAKSAYKGGKDAVLDTADSFTDIDLPSWDEVYKGLNDGAVYMSTGISNAVNSSYEYIDEVNQNINKAGGLHEWSKELSSKHIEDLKDLASDIEVIYKNRDTIFNLCQYISDGRVDLIEGFVEGPLRDIDEELYQEMVKSDYWQGTLELIAEKETIVMPMQYFEAMLKIIPPNFYARIFFYAGITFVIELVLFVVLAALGGVGAVAKLVALLNRIRNISSKADSAISSFLFFLDKLVEVLKKIKEHAKIITIARRKMLTNKSNGRVKKEEEKEIKCPSKPKKGNVTYVQL